MSGWQYYYSVLTVPEHRAAYHAMITGLKELAPVIRIPHLDGETLSTLFFQLRLDHPEIFYAVGYSCRAAIGSDSWDFLPDYMFQKQKIREQQKALNARMERILRPAKELDVLSREQYIHDFILDNVKYDKLEKPYSHEIIGPMTNGVGVCEGIAKTVKLLCDHLDIPCMIPISDRNRANGEKYLHAWNIVTIEKKNYHLDATFDNTLSRDGVRRYDYFNLNDERIFRDHRALLYPTPKCTDGDHFWYREQKLSFTKTEDVEKRIDQAIRKRKENYAFHWRGGYLTRDALRMLCDCIEDAASKRQKGIEIFVNWPQSVLQVRFTAEKPMSIIDEDAGEDVQ